MNYLSHHFQFYYKVQIKSQQKNIKKYILKGWNQDTASFICLYIYLGGAAAGFSKDDLLEAIDSLTNLNRNPVDRCRYCRRRRHHVTSQSTTICVYICIRNCRSQLFLWHFINKYSNYAYWKKISISKF